jgi:hypothetical protein
LAHEIVSGNADRLRAILIENPWAMRMLGAARAVGAPDWLVGGGVIRTLVWDHLHEYETPTPLRDVDLAFFQSENLSSAVETSVEHALRGQAPDIPWQARNQARVHLWYEAKFGLPVEPLTSSADGVATWPETATSIAVRLEVDGSLTVVAPCGLDDLFALVLRRNPRRVSRELFLERARDKRITECWPRVRVIDS